ncbi:argonaute binding protein 1 [Schizosaccharomyces japonicus yFS275]|uniref:Argonaute binding protein 1 n=1 Tax=Schizosaccharomyces japonicus (strain yFS275 / FY16936) TaxID=402676 RepID=B6K0N6_SCHJY|nr:argonaute binding protein 1 [Schizosaccharomyces japonicus yFS275]EEB07507.2 argonaute binding protein 1 [Schizosaccharomyces japonicus yFS275]
MELDEAERLEQKRRKRRQNAKNKRKRRKNEFSGWEVDFVEPELTPDEVKENTALYDSKLPLIVRMERFIQRYRLRRKWSDPVRLRLFSMYLAFGGIATGQKQFTGGIDIDNAEDAAEIATQSAVDFIDDERMENVEDVDFLWVVRTFLSSYLQRCAGIVEEAHLALAAQLIRNFLRSLLHNNVAPEFADNIREACELCVRAEVELVSCKRLSVALPGRLQNALRAIYTERGLWDPQERESSMFNYSGSAASVTESTMTDAETVAPSSSFTATDSPTITSTSETAAAVPEVENMWEEDVNTPATEPTAMSSATVSLHADAVRRFTTEQAIEYVTNVLGPTALGGNIVDSEDLLVRLESVRPWTNRVAMPTSGPGEVPEQLVEASLRVSDPPGSLYPQQTKRTQFVVLFENSLLTNVRIGTYLEATFKFLDNGLVILDSTMSVMPTFYEEYDD